MENKVCQEEPSRFIFEKEEDLCINNDNVYNHMKETNNLIIKSIALRLNSENINEIGEMSKKSCWIKCNGINNILFLAYNNYININFNNCKSKDIKKVYIDGLILYFNLVKLYFNSGNCLKNFTIVRANIYGKGNNNFLNYLYSSTCIIDISDYQPSISKKNFHMKLSKKKKHFICNICNISNNIIMLRIDLKDIKVQKIPFRLDLIILYKKIIKNKKFLN